MKKILIVVLLICLCVALAACTSTDIVYYTGAYQYGNMQKNLPPGNFMLLGNEVLFNPFQTEKTVIYSYDLHTGKVQPLCKDATCKHFTCIASVEGNLEVYNGKLYAKNIESEDSTKTQPVIVNDNTVEVIIPADVNTFFHHENKLYFNTPDSSLMVLEEGQKEPQMVLDEYTGFWHTIWGNYLYANKWDFSIVRVDITGENSTEEVLVTNAMGMTDGQYIYYTDETTLQLYRCNMDGTDPQLIEEREVHSGSINFDDEYFYYRLCTEGKLVGTSDCYDVYRFPKNDPTQIEKIATLPDPVWQVFTVPGTEKIFATTYTATGGHGPIYVMGTDGSNPTKLEIPEY